MRFLVACSTILFLTFQLNAQDGKAKKILDDLSKKTRSFSSYEADFTSTLINKQSNIKESQSGTVVIKDNKYKIDMGDQVIMSNGIKVWTYLRAENQVFVSDFDPSDDDMINPNKVFTIWESGYKYKYVESSTHKGTKVDVIELYPKDAKKSKFHTVRLKIDSSGKGLVYILIKGKDGTNMEYVIDQMTPNKSFPDSEFVFNKGKYPGVEVIEN